MTQTRRPSIRLLPTGLRWRLAACVAAVVIISSGISFLVVYKDTGTQVRHEIDDEIGGDMSEFARTMASARDRSPAGLARTARAYVRVQPFQASSTLLFALIPGAPVSTNRPEFFGSPAPDRGESVRAQDVEDRESAGLLGAPNGYSILHLPDVGAVRLLKRTLPAAGPRVVLGVAEPLAPVARAQRGVARAYLLAGILTLAGALLAAYLIGSRFSRPLRRMAAVAARVDAGELAPRIVVPAGQSHEVRVLADAFNHMLDRLTEAFSSQRDFVADASHELRTPLTAIGGQLEVLAEGTTPTKDEVERVSRMVQAEIARTTRLVEDMLTLVRLEDDEFLIKEAVDLRSFVEQIWDGSTLLAPRSFRLAPVPEGRLHADGDRIAQALRNLINNAIAHTRPETGIVCLVVRTQGSEVSFSVEDNGPGIPVDERERVFDRFYRTDAARDRASGGTGLGLAIVKAIAEAHGGSVEADRSQLGGARVTIRLPVLEQRFTFLARQEAATASGSPEA